MGGCSFAGACSPRGHEETRSTPPRRASSCTSSGHDSQDARRQRARRQPPRIFPPQPFILAFQLFDLRLLLFGHFCCHHALNSSYGIASGVALIAPLIPTTVRSGSSLQGQQKVTANLAMVTGRPSGNLNSRVSRCGGVNDLLGGAPFGAGRGAACGVGRGGAAAGATRGAACGAGAAFAALTNAWLVARRRCCFWFMLHVPSFCFRLSSRSKASRACSIVCAIDVSSRSASSSSRLQP